MRDSTLHFLPQEILTQILTKLPAKSLVRLRCVSKFFCSLITDPLFADLHRNWSLTIPGRTSILISLPGQVYMSYAYYTINYNEEENHGDGYLRANRVLYLDEKQWNFTRLDSSAHGLLCLSTICDDNSTALCNLSTRKHTFLPRISLPHHYLRWARTLVGFDPISKKYKLLKSGVCVDNLGINTMWKHWVFTLGVDTSWREINCVGFYFPTETYRLSSFDTSVYIDGVIYSSNLLKEHKNRLNKDGLVPGFDIAAFDVGVENFRWISFPDDYSPIDSALVDMDGRLAIIQVRYLDTLCRRYNIEIWSLEKSMKWGMRRTIPIPLEGDQLVFRTSLTTTHFGEIVLLIVTREFVSIFVYELGRQVWRMFKICGLHDYQLSEMNRQIVVDSIPENMFFP